MDDIIEIFEEFEKKYIKLIKDIILRPKLVVNSLSSQENDYVKPFRFFSYVSSIFLLIIIGLNRFDIAGFWSESFFLPAYWEEYYQSANELNITLFPITGLFFIVLISSVLSFLFFRKPKKRSYKEHLHLTFYLSGILLIYLLIVTLVVILIDAYVSEYSDLAELALQSLIVFLLIVIPSLFVIRIHWELGGNKILRPLKTLIVMFFTGYLFSSFYYDLELDRIANDLIFYRETAQKPFTSANSKVSKSKIYSAKDNFYLYPTNTFSNSKNYLVPLYAYQNNEVGIYEVKDTVKKINTFNRDYFNAISVYNFEDKYYCILHQHSDDQSKNLLYESSNGKMTLVHEDSIKFNTRSSIVYSNDKYLISGINQKRKATLYGIRENSLLSELSLDQSNTNFDYLLPSSDTSMVTVTSTTESGNINKIEINVLDLKSGEVVNSASLFENRITTVPAYHEWNQSDLKVYNPWVTFSEDSTSIFVAYQLMTDKTFELQLYRLNPKLEVLSKKHVKLDANMSYFYSYGLDGKKLYVFGKRFLLVPNNVFGSQESQPFLMSFELEGLEHQKTKHLDSYAEMYGRKLAGGIRSHLYLERVKMNFTGDSIEILTMTNYQVLRLKTPKF